MTRILALVVGVVAFVGCQGSDPEPTVNPTVDPGSAGSAVIARDATPGFGNQELDDAGALPPVDAGSVKPEEPEPPDAGKLIAELGAIAAWQTVIDRAQLLARRGQHGIAYGTLGPPIMMLGPVPEPTDAGVKALDAGLIASPYVWLVDDTEGNGTLGIRVALGKYTANEGQRVALGGAWHLDDDRRWFWKVDSLQALPPGPPSDLKDPPAAVPGHEIVRGNLPSGARTITVSRDNDAVYFQIVGPAPARDGDGWLVANELGDTPFALMTLPGERPTYGGQDMRAADERWLLKKGQTYWVRIGKIRKRAPEQPVVVHARTAPVRVN
ncbi:MAG: hypothetical protein H0T89_20710 [Deltaproteobacteria bacterium]|nr:hypothetical protein [Deltaproteobacteria bacterium]MDQ3297333.1 hypothetical protein [Myxococcota bacterium]